MSVSGDSSGGMYVISGLMPSTTYSIQVAAETSAGTGPYTSPLTIETPYNSKHIIYTTAYVSNLFNQCYQAERAKNPHMQLD